MGWVKYSTIGATAGTDLKESDGTVLTDTAVKNSSIALGVDGTSLTLTNAGSGVTLAKANVGLGSVDNTSDATVITNARAATVWGDVAGTTNAPANNATVGAAWGSNLSGRPGELTDGRVAAGLTSSGDVDRAVPTAKGGTGETNTNKFLNSGISVSQSGSTFTLTRGDGGTDTTTISKGVLGLNYTDGATVGAVAGTNLKAENGTTTLGDNDVKNSALDVDISGTAIKLKIGNTETSTVTASQALVGLSGVANNATVGAVAGTNLYKENGSTTLGDDDIVTNVGTSANTNNVGNITVSNAQSRLGAITNAGAWDGSTIAVGKGGTGTTASTTWLNSNVTTFSINKGNYFTWTNISGQLSPSNTTDDWTITWYNGAGTSLGTTVIRATVNGTSNGMSAMTQVGTGVQDSLSLGGAANSGVIQTTTVTKNSVVCTLTAQCLDGSGWGFK